jgi:hypothetical protein
VRKAGYIASLVMFLVTLFMLGGIIVFVISVKF